MAEAEQRTGNMRTTNGTASSIVTVPRNNDISQPAIMTVPGSYNYQPPRNYMLTAKLSF